MWFDAMRQPAAREARKMPTPGPALDVWLDGSGHGRHVVQRVADAQPRWQQTEGGAFVHFDGKDDWLGAANLGASFEKATVFVVAAPRSNPGFFRGFISLAQVSRNDYTSGLNLDLGGNATQTLTVINTEGAGAGGAGNLLTTQFDFGTFHVYSLASDVGPGAVRLFVDGLAQGRRDRTPSTIRADEIAIGARLYSNSGDPVFAGSMLEGDIAEVLVYGRALSDAERGEVEHYLVAKYNGLKTTPANGGHALVTVKDPPPVQMLVPGFTVRELPVELTNIDNVRYRADGKLVAVGYNGHMWVLSDTNGDGLEDKAVPFWDKDTIHAPIGAALTPPGYARGQGVFVAAKNRVSLVVDTNGDDKADEEITVATWEEPSSQHGVDGLGCAVGPDGSIYFSVGAADFGNGYQLDKDGKAHYRLESDRGTIQRVSPDFSKRETVCRGIRFAVGLAFNKNGDLFATDQEGATWMPNGNPLDELLHIQAGRYYGFPPRHPKHLPGVFDEPSTFDYAPQHQSTCGLQFNDGAATFGPAWWAGDALVTGESRGKLYRTKLVKTPVGYVAQNQLYACVSMLTVDQCVSPQGDLVVACHSGGPDWGSGPEGKGKLFKITRTAKDAPEPVMAWSEAPDELHVAFDREIDAAKLKDFSKSVKIEQGKFVAAGDRFESFRPGYQVVKDQMAASRFEVPVLATALSADRREIVLTTPPRTAAVNYAVTMPDFTGTSSTPRHPDIDVASDLSGVMAEWKGADGTTWNGWLPHADLAVSRELTSANADHAKFFASLAKSGQLKLTGQLDLWQMLQPAIQPGAKLDYERPIEVVHVVFSSPWAFRLTTKQSARNSTVVDGRHVLDVETTGRENEWLAYTAEILVPAGGKPDFMVHWITLENPIARPFAIRRFLVPWAQPKAEPVLLAGEREIPEIKDGNWARGRKLFFSDALLCGRCHTVRGEGARIGPDLSNLTQRDYASVLRDIREPSRAINPDHTAFTVETTDGAAQIGVLQSDAKEAITLASLTGTVTIPRAKVKSIKPMAISLMPEALTNALPPEQLRDLMTFLLAAPLEPALVEAPNPPPARTRAEVDALLKKLAPPSANLKPFNIVLCDGPKDHGKGEHDYPLWKKRWSKLLALSEGVNVSTASSWPDEKQWREADLVVFFSNNPGWNAARVPEFDAYLARGKGVAYFHWAVDGHDAGDQLADRLGLAVRSSMTKFRHGALDLAYAGHPLTAGLPAISLIDETYWGLVGDESKIKLIGSVVEEGSPRPQMWTREQGGGRVFVSIPGHYNWTFDDPYFRALAFRGLCWAGGQPIDRLAELIPIGARIGEPAVAQK
jgi:putative heme-binding domain-containing protein